ncbi:MAG: 5-formyltetrahydrofolate cyclo-ligase [Paludibacteraceae bacterium]|nr:5-formyltetrahydrofolate cyclo-ligase [Paludibacteraceae bacterium]
MNRLGTILSSLTGAKRKNVVSEKQKIRNYIRQRKELLTETDKAIEAQKLFDKIELMPEFEDAQTILLYWSMPDELPTHNFIVKWSKRKQILLPVVKDDDMLIRPFSGKDDLKRSTFGIWEPDSQKEFMNKIDLVIAPGIAFDRRRSRLGRGKGYYDRFFVNKRIVKIGVGFDFQLLESIPTHQYDIKMDKIITPSFDIE